MFELNDAFRQFAKKHLGVADNGDDAACRAAIAKALAENRISRESWVELTANKAPSGVGTVERLIDARFKTLETTLVGHINTLLAPHAGNGNGNAGAGGAGGAGSGGAGNNGNTGTGGAGGGTGNDDAIVKGVKAALAGMGYPTGDGTGGGAGGDGPITLLSRAAQSGWISDSGNIRVKNPLERYDHSRTAVHYPSNHKYLDLRGKRLCVPEEGGGRPLDRASQADKAVIGAYWKYCVHQSMGDSTPKRWRPTDHDLDIMKYAVHELPWRGVIGGDPETGERGTGINGVKLTDVKHNGLIGTKALLDDAISGGIQAAPIVIEDQLIIIPLLYGELFPRVTVRDVARGRRIHAATIGRPTLTSGTPEGTPIPLFDTSNFLGTLDTSIFTAVGAMEIGLDFEEDSPSDVGGTIITEYGEAMKAWLDRVIATGDGVSEPLGIFNTAGLTVVNSASGTSGPLSVADAEGLMFGVVKAFRVARGANNVFIGNETTYRRFRAVPLGSAWANSRAFGSDYNAYEVLGHPFAVVITISNNNCAYANLGFYRMYRRLGIQVRVETAGKELALANTKAIVVRARWGGQVEQGGGFATMPDAPN